MKTLRQIKTGLAAVAAIGASLSASASVTMQYSWTGSYWEAGFSVTEGGQQLVNTDDAIGIYAFTDASGKNVLNSVCLDPAGLLDESSHTYNALSFSQANPGLYPNKWASGVVGGVTQDWGINNAAYLWSTVGLSIVNNTTWSNDQRNEESAAFAFAVWKVLYDSTAYGKVTGSYFDPTTTLQKNADGSARADGAALLADYNADLLAVNNGGPVNGWDVLRGTDAADGPSTGQSQEFFVPVPEPSTIIAGLLLALPFGVSAYRSLRRSQAR